MNKFYQWLRNTYAKTVNSIAFYPALIALGFLALALLMLSIDFSEQGKELKARLSWLSLRDASTARTILTTIAAGIISLTVFSFSMVMILLSQAASQMSNRMLDSMIGNRFQQVVLGCYIGTIIYSLFLLSTIRDISSGVYVPALSIYLLLLLTVIDIFLFIYFLHYVTQSVKYETIIQRIRHQTLHTLEHTCVTEQQAEPTPEPGPAQTIFMPATGYLQGYSHALLLPFAQKRGLRIRFLHPFGTYLLEGSPLLAIHGNPLNEKEVNELMALNDCYRGQPIEKNAYYGFHQLTEVAVKALSPGINDPQTAVLCIQALSDLLRFRLAHHPPVLITDNENEWRIQVRQRSFPDLFEECLYPILDYGKNDRFVHTALLQAVHQLIRCDEHRSHHPLLERFLSKLEQAHIGMV
jgi:uncharacterized membrane protein